MHTEKDLSTTEFVLLYDFVVPYWNYERFELHELTNAECNAEFPFYENDIYKLADALQFRVRH